MNENGSGPGSHRGILMFAALAVLAFGGLAASTAAETDRENDRDYSDRLGKGRHIGPASYINVR